MPAYKYKTKDGKQFWYASFHYKTWNGEQKRKVKRGFITKKEALEFERAFLDHGRKDPELLFSSLVDEYLKDCEQRLKPTTMETKKWVISTKISPYFGNMKLSQVDALAVRRWQNELLDEPEGYSQTYLHTIHSQLSAILNFAVAFYGLSSNPCHAAGGIGKSTADEMTIWSREQFEQFLKLEKRRAFHLAFNLLYYTGMREGELLALTPADIPKNDMTVHINKNFAVVDNVQMFLTPKTEKSQRSIPIHAQLHDEAIRFIHDLHLDPDDRIFYFKKDGLLGELKRITMKAELPEIRVHDLRHSHVSLLIHMGVPITEISKRLGHKSPQTTLRIYAHMLPGNERNAANLIGQLFEENMDES